MSSGSAIDVTLLERLSALADGELDDSAAAAACASWRCEAAARASWHAYQLIGDVLRSEDLAADPARDAEFLRTLRSRLAQEPVVIGPSPEPLRSPSDGSFPDAGVAGGRRWFLNASVAVAAGFVAVAGVFMLTRTVEPAAPAGTSLARADAPLAVSTGASALAAIGPEATAQLAAGGNVIRDARLDGYLAAHKQFAGSSALGVPSAFLRSATMQTPGR